MVKANEKELDKILFGKTPELEVSLRAEGDFLTLYLPAPFWLQHLCMYILV